MSQEPLGAPRNPALMEAARAYVRAAVEALAGLDPPERPHAVWPDERWVESSPRAYIRQRQEHFYWLGFSLRDEVLHGIREYASALAALEADPAIGPQLGQLVGTSASATQLQKERVLNGLAIRMTYDRDLAFDEERFRAAYLELETELYATTIPYVAFAPVAGLATAPPLHFADIELDHVTDDEASALLDAGLLQSHSMGPHTAIAHTEYVLRVRYELPKVVGPAAQNATDPFAGIPDVGAMFLEVLSALRVLKGEPVVIPGVVTSQVSRTGGMLRNSSTITTARIWAPQYTLTEAEGEELLRLWVQLRDSAVRHREFISTAIRRFGYAGERSRSEDRFIDLMVAAEALFLGEKRKGETNTELTYKISTRFAYFTEIQGTTRRERFEHMKAAYSARSSIVHGDRPKGLRTQLELDSFTDRTSRELRHALRAMIDLAQREPTRRPLVDWDEVILGPTDASAG